MATTVRELIDYVVRALVEHPDKVAIRESKSELATVYELTVHPEDRGRVIGKNGQTIRAIRNLVSAAAALQGGSAVVDVRD
jgi:predicted RNA-binding protein YlqC (UPF0109 family)